MPIVASMGGTTGNQTLAVVVRALATKELTSRNTIRMIVKEFLVRFYKRNVVCRTNRTYYPFVVSTVYYDQRHYCHSHVY